MNTNHNNIEKKSFRRQSGNNKCSKRLYSGHMHGPIHCKQLQLFLALALTLLYSFMLIFLRRPDHINWYDFGAQHFKCLLRFVNSRLHYQPIDYTSYLLDNYSRHYFFFRDLDYQRKHLQLIYKLLVHWWT